MRPSGFVYVEYGGLLLKARPEDLKDWPTVEAWAEAQAKRMTPEPAATEMPDSCTTCEYREEMERWHSEHP